MKQLLPMVLISSLGLTGCVTDGTGSDAPSAEQPIASTQAAANGCSSGPITHGWNIESGDQRLSASELAPLVRGQRLSYASGGYEAYNRDGTYTFVAGGTTSEGSGYVLYPDGSRCISYDQPRYDMYVLRDGNLILINRNGDRFAITP